MREIAVAVGRMGGEQCDVRARPGEEHDRCVHAGALSKVLGMSSEARLNSSDEVFVDRGSDQGVDLTAAYQALALVNAVERRGALRSLRVPGAEALRGGGAREHPRTAITRAAGALRGVDPVDHAEAIRVQTGAFRVLGEYGSITDKEAIGSRELGSCAEQDLGADPGGIAHATAQKGSHETGTWQPSSRSPTAISVCSSDSFTLG